MQRVSTPLIVEDQGYMVTFSALYLIDLVQYILEESNQILKILLALIRNYFLFGIFI